MEKTLSEMNKVGDKVKDSMPTNNQGSAVMGFLQITFLVNFMRIISILKCNCYHSI